MSDYPADSCAAKNRLALLAHLGSLDENPEIQEITKLLESIRDEENPLELLVDDYLRFHKLSDAEELTESDKEGLEMHAKFMALRTLASSQPCTEDRQMNDRGRDSWAAQENLVSGVRELTLEIIPFNASSDGFSSPSYPSPFRATIPAGPPPPSARETEPVPYDETKLKPKTTAFAYADEEMTVISGTLASITYGMKGAKIVIENGAKLDLFMAGDGVTIVLKGPDSYVRIQKAGRNCKKIRLIGPEGQRLTSKPKIELGAGLEEKIA